MSIYTPEELKAQAEKERKAHNAWQERKKELSEKYPDFVADPPEFVVKWCFHGLTDSEKVFRMLDRMDRTGEMDPRKAYNTPMPGEKPYDTSVLGVTLALSKFMHGSTVIDWGKVL